MRIRSLLATIFLLTVPACGGLPLESGEEVPEDDRTPPEGIQSGLSMTAFGLRPEVLRDIRIYVDFSGAAVNTPERIDELKRAVDLAMAMWQSVLPDLRVRWASSEAGANVIFRIGDYRGVTIRECTPGWLGCSFFPMEGKLPSDPVIYLNDQGQETAFQFDALTHVEFKRLVESYRPATYPPHGYQPATSSSPAVLGATQGRYLEDMAGGDLSILVFHEFAHSLGMTHYNWNEPLARAWYGVPRDPLTGQPVSNATIQVDASRYPDLAAAQSTYLGGGTYDPATGEAQELLPGINLAHEAWRNHMHGNDRNNFIPAGIPGLPAAEFNNRIVFDGDIAYMPKYPFAFPLMRGLVRLERDGGADIRLSHNWTEAAALSKIGTVDADFPYMMRGIYPRVRGRQILALGGNHGLTVRPDRTLWVWGANDKGQLGDGTTTNRSLPKKLTGTNWVSVAAGGNSSFAIDISGRLWAWGGNASGQLGNGTTTDSRTPRLVCDDANQDCFTQRFVSVCASGGHVAALSTEGMLWTWGLGTSGQLGDGTLSNRRWPTQVGWDTSWIDLACGGAHTLALQADGSLWAWGRNGDGQLGLGDTTDRLEPTLVPGRSDWASVGAGALHSLVITTGGELWTFGDNGNGQLGDGTRTDRTRPVRETTRATDWWSAVGGNMHSLGAKANGALRAWGTGVNGQVGDGNTDTNLTPVLVGTSKTPNAGYVVIAAGWTHSMALKSEGTAWGWGSNNLGQLGNAGTTSPVLVPTQSRVTVVFPKIDLVAPALGSVEVPRLFAPASLKLDAYVVANTKKVEFFDGATKLGEDTSDPYSFTATNLAFGRHTFTAKVTDHFDLTTTSSPVIASVGTTVSLTADAYVRDGGSANTNFGTATTLEVSSPVGASAGERRLGFIKLGLTGVPATFHTAVLEVFGGLTAPGSVWLTANDSTSTGWSETGLTWNNRPGLGTDPQSAFATNDTTAQWLVLDTTNQVRTHKAAGRSTVTFILHNRKETPDVLRINTREASSNRPRLVIMP